MLYFETKSTQIPDEPYFFRHTGGKGGVTPGEKYGEKMFTKVWNEACKLLNVDGVTLYAGTRHSSAIALRHYISPEQIKAATGHNTTKAFERYFFYDEDDLRKTYSLTLQDERGKRLAKAS
ncbi:MAG: hypothetical protein B5M55_01635 [Desulfococcus sp. 4484_242]|nr:MAG: hypothetical protein B5M55_01635 [Desulfococcus sp. 4484_242]